MELLSIKVSAPGKVILHGEHAVVYGKTAIATALGMRTALTLKEITSSPEDRYLKLILPNIQYEQKANLTSITQRYERKQLLYNAESFDHENHLKIVNLLIENEELKCSDELSANALRAILYMFTAIVLSDDVELNSVEVCIESELTIGAGTGSSASFAVCLAGAFLRLSQLKRHVQIGSDFSCEDRKLISDWAFNCERIMHGLPSGIDNTVCTYGSIVSFRKGFPAVPLQIELSMRVLLVDTRVTRETKKLVQNVAALRERNLEAVDHIMEACNEVTISAFKILMEISKNTSDNVLNYERLSELWEMNHCLLAALKVSHPSLERIRTIVHNCDPSLACKLTGAGGGGYAMILLHPKLNREKVSELVQELIENNFSVQETSLAGHGVKTE